MPESLRVLLVDDNPNIISLLSCGLGAFRIDVTAYNDADRAIAGYKGISYDLHLIDVWMPKMSGFDLARAIWKQNPTAQICFLSAFEMDMSQAQSMFGSVQSECLLSKPISANELATHVWSHFGAENKLR